MVRFSGIAMVCTWLAAGMHAQSTNEADRAVSVTNTSDWIRPVSELNRNLPSRLRFDGEFRDRLETFGGIGFHDQSDNHDLTRFRFMTVIKPTSWLQFAGEMQDSRVFFNQHIRNAPPYQNTFDVRQAYVQLGDAGEGSIALVAGRQILSFGAERLIGPSDWQNMGRTFDAVRLDLHRQWFRLSLFASSVIIARDGVIDHHNQGNNLHGAYGQIRRVIPRCTIEPYVLWRVAPGVRKMNEATVGTRVVGDAPAGIEYDVEMARQTGSLGSASIGAWAGHWNLARPLKTRLAPRPFVEVNYASGTKDPSGARWSTFDQLYPSSHNKLGFADQVGWRNIEQVRAGVSETVGRKWTLTETYGNFWLASARDALYSSSGAPVVQSPAGAAGRHVGQEFDAWAGRKWGETIELGVGYARFFTGEFLNRTTPGKDFNYPFIYLTYDFTPSKSPRK
jgi:hypothetical protein